MTVGVVVALVLLAGSGLAVQAQSWTVLGAMPVANSEFDAARIGDHIYSVGGINDARASELWRYTPKTDSWRQLADLPEPSHHIGIAALGGKLYAVGGSGSEGRLQVYDPLTDTWFQGAPPPTLGTAMAVAVVRGKLHSLGGTPNIFGGIANSTHEVYDPARDSWSVAAPVPIATEHVKAEVIGGKVFVIGGRSGAANRGELQIYDPATDSWTEGARLPVATSGMATGVVDGEIYVFGGEDLDDRVTLDEVQRYDPVEGVWTLEEPLPAALHGLAGATFGSSIYVFGGSPGAGSAAGSDFVGRFDPPGVLPIESDALEAPRRLKAKTISDNKARLKWKFRDQASDADTIEIEVRRESKKKFRLVATVPVHPRKVVLEGFKPGRSYVIRLRASGPSGPSGYSNQRTVTF